MSKNISHYHIAKAHCHINQCNANVQYLTDISQQREEYEVLYHSYSSSWSGISVLFYDKLTLYLCHLIKQTILPNSDPTRRGLSGRSPT